MSNSLSIWHRFVEWSLRMALLREDGTPCKHAGRVMFTRGSLPRAPFARTIFRKNGLPRTYLDQETRDFLESALLVRWIAKFDSPTPDEIDQLAAVSGLQSPGLMLVEMDDAIIADPVRLSRRLDLSGKWRPELRFLPFRELLPDELRRLAQTFGSRALDRIEARHLPK